MEQTSCGEILKLLKALHIADNRRESLLVGDEKIYIVYNEFNREKKPLDLHTLKYIDLIDETKNYNSINFFNGNVYLLNLTEQEYNSFSKAGGVP